MISFSSHNWKKWQNALAWVDVGWMDRWMGGWADGRMVGSGESAGDFSDTDTHMRMHMNVIFNLGSLHSTVKLSVDPWSVKLTYDLE